MNKYLSLLIALFFTLNLSAQEKEYTIGGEDENPKNDSIIYVRLGAQLPYQYNLSLAYQFTNKIAAELLFGSMPTSFQDYIFNNFESLGMNSAKSEFLKTYFISGQTIGLSVNYKLNENSYIRGGGHMLDITPNRVDKDLLLSIYNTSVTDFEQEDENGDVVEMHVLSKARIYNVELYYGRKIANISKRLSFVTEIGFAKALRVRNYFWPQNYLFDNFEDFSNRMEPVSSDLQSEISKSFFMPTLNLYLRYRLKTCDC